MKPFAWRLILTFAAGMLVGTSHVLVKRLLNLGIEPVSIAFVQVGVAGLVLATALRFGGRPLRNDRRSRRYFLVSALIGVAALPLLGNWVLARIPVSTFAVVATLAPGFTSLFDALAERRLPPASVLTGVVFGLAGALWLLLPPAQRVAPQQTLALLAAVGVPLLLAALNVYRSRFWPPGLGVVAASAGNLVVQALVLAPVFFASLFLTRADGDSAALASAWPLLGLVAAIAIASALTGGALLRIGGASAYGQIGYVIAMTGIAGGALVFGESLTPSFWPAALLVFAGVLFANRAVALPPTTPRRQLRRCEGSPIPCSGDRNEMGL